jgi:hypothetical protein
MERAVFERSEITKKIVEAVKDHMKKNVGIFFSLGELRKELDLPVKKMNSNIKDFVLKDFEEEGILVEKYPGRGFRIIAEEKTSAYEVKSNEPTVNITLKEKPQFQTEKPPAIPAFFAEAIQSMGEDIHILIYNKKQAKLVGPTISQDFDAEAIDFNCKYTKEQGVTVDMKITNSYKF